jgi:hypothetical protein
MKLREIWRFYSVGFEDRGKAMKPGMQSGSRSWERAKRQIFPYRLLSERSPANTDLSPVKSSWNF